MNTNLNFPFSNLTVNSNPLTLQEVETKLQYLMEQLASVPVYFILRLRSQSGSEQQKVLEKEIQQLQKLVTQSTVYLQGQIAYLLALYQSLNNNTQTIIEYPLEDEIYVKANVVQESFTVLLKNNREANSPLSSDDYTQREGFNFPRRI